MTLDQYIYPTLVSIQQYTGFPKGPFFVYWESRLHPVDPLASPWFLASTWLELSTALFQVSFPVYCSQADAKGDGSTWQEKPKLNRYNNLKN